MTIHIFVILGILIFSAAVILILAYTVLFKWFSKKWKELHKKKTALEQEKMSLQASHEAHQREKTDLIATNTSSLSPLN